MAFRVFDDGEQGANVIVAVVAIPVTIAVVFLRVLSTVRAGKGVGLENWFALLALVAFLVYASIDLWLICTINGTIVLELESIPQDKVVAIYKGAFVVNIVAPLNQTFAKLCLLALYHRLFYISKGFLRWVCAVGGAQIIWCIAVICFRLFLCKPIADAWNPRPKGKCYDGQILIAWGDSINSLLDFIMVGMTIWVVLGLRVSTAAKIRISFLFALGGFAGVIGILKIGEAWGTIGTHIRNATWNMAQQATSIVCCCVPIYNNLLSTLKGKRRHAANAVAMRNDEFPSPRPNNITQREIEVVEDTWLPLDDSSKSELMLDTSTTKTGTRARSNIMITGA